MTVVLDEAAARWLRIEAARRDNSVSQFLGELVERERAREPGYEAAMHRFLARPPRELGPRGRPLPSREEMHER
ncbi:MAG TPA: hypothetical protein VMK65_12190 [Longimicrobiales bacterium]|nr:hypothetical protein [Longimicrobiales bacterium]